MPHVLMHLQVTIGDYYLFEAELPLMFDPPAFPDGGENFEEYSALFQEQQVDPS